MPEPFEVRLSNYQIEKATARLAHQRAAVRRLGFEANPYLAQAASAALATMESRLAKLLLSHASLLERQGKPTTAKIHNSLRHAGFREFKE